jgi:uncharacterized protein YcbX
MSSVVSRLMIYPVKSLGGIELKSAEVNPKGLGLDRRWMLVDNTGRMVTQRTHPLLSQIQTKLKDTVLSLMIQGQSFQVPSAEGEALTVKVWEDSVSARRIGGDISEKISSYVGQELELVWMGEQTIRPVESRSGTENKEVGFADGFPFLVISEASLQDLNRRLAQPVTMERFRPNIVVSQAAAFEEDTWKRFTIGDVCFINVKPCARCVMTTVDPFSGLKGKEPLRTLGEYRRRDGEVFFGQNAVHQGMGTLFLGDRVDVLESQSAVI